GAFEDFRARENKDERQLHVEHGKPLRFGKEGKKGLLLNARTFRLEIVTLREPVPSDGNLDEEADILVHDQSKQPPASMQAVLPFPEFPVVLGVLYRSERPTYDGTLTAQMASAVQRGADLDTLLQSGATWTVD